MHRLTGWVRYRKPENVGRPPIHENLVKAMRIMRENKQSYRQIASTLMVSHTTVWKYCKDVRQN